MPYTLKDRVVLVTGGGRGLGATVCDKFAKEGANIMINYVENRTSAEEVAKKVEAHGVKACIIQGDAGRIEDNARIVQETVKQLGGLDIIVANAGWTRFTDFGDLNAMSDDEWNKCWTINVMSHLKLMQVAGPIFDTNPDGGVYLLTSSIASKVQGGSSMAYSVTKAAGVHLMKCIAATQAPKTRINAILPGLLLTEWGMSFKQDKISQTKNRALLKHETFLDDCAEVYVTAAKNTSMTGQCITVDAGLAPL